MPMFRSASHKSTLSMMQRRTTRYQKWLNLSNVFLLVTSTLIIFTAAVLIKFYHLTKLDFWSVYFSILPNYTVALGVFTFLVSCFGFAVSGSEKRRLLAGYGFLLALVFLGQLGSIFVSLELRNIINQSGVGGADVNKDLSEYGIDPAITAKWDTLQRDLHCCGGHNFLTGYQDYKPTPIGQNFSVPDSCCNEYHDGCGQKVFKESPERIRNKIFVNGCLTMLTERLEKDVVPMLVIFACIGVLLALVELITVVLSCAYVAQLNRRRRREDRGWNVDDRIGDAADNTHQGTML